MQGIILAAGMGKRLKELTADNTKCMVKVNGVTLIDRMLHQLEKLGLSRVVIVVGYQGQKLKNYIATLDLHIPIAYVENPIYEQTNNIYSLWLARGYLLQEDTLLLESDIIFEDSVIQALAEDPAHVTLFRLSSRAEISISARKTSIIRPLIFTNSAKFFRRNITFLFWKHIPVHSETTNTMNRFCA
mgnify:CR=1 FL=1